MIIKAVAHGEPDATPLILVFQYESPADEVFVASVKNVADLLEGGRRININQAILLLVARAIDSLNGGRSKDQTCMDISGMIRTEQVMIGVPEMLRKLDIEIILKGSVTRLAVHAPISIRFHDMERHR